MPSRNNRKSRNNAEDQSTRRRNHPFQTQRPTSQQQPPVTSAVQARSDASGNPVSPAQQREIPGFYYDEDKKRYFKIQKDHQAPRGAYSATTVSLKNENAQKKLKVKERQIRDSRKFQRSKIFCSDIIATLHRRELGSHLQLGRTNASRFLLSELYGSSSTCTQTCHQISCSPSSAITSNTSQAAYRYFATSSARPTNTSRSSAQLSSAKHDSIYPRVLFDADMFIDGPYPRRTVNVTFKYDHRLQGLILAVYGLPSGSFFCWKSWIAAFDRSNPFGYHGVSQNDLPQEAVRGFGVSVVALKNTGEAPAALGTGSPAVTPKIITTSNSDFMMFDSSQGLLNVVLGCHIDKQCFSTHLENWSPQRVVRIGFANLQVSRGSSLIGFNPSYQVSVEHEIVPLESETRERMENEYDYWCAAMRPKPRGALEFFQAVSNTYQSVIIDSAVGPEGIRTVENTGSSVLAIEFTSPNSWLCGLRNGTISHVDFQRRVRCNRKIATHPGAVTNIVALRGGTFFIANGIPDCLCLYDMRRIKEDKDSLAIAEPVLRYDHHNAKYPSLDMGFDVCENLDLIAAAQDDGSINLFSISTGQTLQKLSAPLAEKEALIPFRTIQIVEEERGYCRVLAARHNRIFDFARHYD